MSHNSRVVILGIRNSAVKIDQNHIIQTISCSSKRNNRRLFLQCLRVLSSRNIFRWIRKFKKTHTALVSDVAIISRNATDYLHGFIVLRFLGRVHKSTGILTQMRFKSGNINEREKIFQKRTLSSFWTGSLSWETGFIWIAAKSETGTDWSASRLVSWRGCTCW